MLTGKLLLVLVVILGSWPNLLQVLQASDRTELTKIKRVDEQ
jgi:hypothetical protein